MSILPISVADIESYARIYQWDEDLEFFCQCVFALDDEYLRVNAEKRATEAERQKQLDEARGNKRRGRK